MRQSDYIWPVPTPRPITDAKAREDRKRQLRFDALVIVGVLLLFGGVLPLLAHWGL